jgi:hypothetical protein
MMICLLVCLVYDKHGYVEEQINEKIACCMREFFKRSLTSWKLIAGYGYFRLCEGGELLDRILSRWFF